MSLVAVPEALVQAATGEMGGDGGNGSGGAGGHGITGDPTLVKAAATAAKAAPPGKRDRNPGRVRPPIRYGSRVTVGRGS
jgi:hypothetical protein